MTLKFFLRRQLNDAKKNGLFVLLENAAKKHNISLAYLLAVASRETGIRHIEGDWDSKLKVYHGKGIMQIDDRYHPVARGDYWREHPDVIVEYGAGFLIGLQKKFARGYPNFNQYQIEKVAASAYNCGPVGAMKGIANGDSDLRTTGGDYGKDVMRRKAIFTELLAETLPK